MNYRHAFHAGNFADVFKHALLTHILLHLGRKPAPFRYLDTHAGIGSYALDCDPAARNPEWRNGIARLAGADFGEDAGALLRPYLAIVGPLDAEGRPRLYPGSPAIAQALTRAQDKLTLCELHPVDCKALAANMSRDRRVKVIGMDGYMALNAFVPPVERRGLVLIDPPFEARNEFTEMLVALRAAYRKWPTGIYALWYPIKNRTTTDGAASRLASSGITRVLRIELDIAASPLPACGLFVINPPFTLFAQAQVLLPCLARVLSHSGRANWRLDWLAGE